MVTKNEIKAIKLLTRAKGRAEQGLFIAEGPKVVTDLLDAGMQLNKLYSTQEVDGVDFEPVDDHQLAKISQLKSPNQMFATFHIPKTPEFTHEQQKDWVLVLDGINDPGNMGTLIRLADWFGFQCILCSDDGVDPYHPKVVQSSMGSLARVPIHSIHLPTFFTNNPQAEVFGALLDGKSPKELVNQRKGYLMMGSESHGIRPELLPLVRSRITIPKHNTTSGIDSLNVATAAAVLMAAVRA